MNNLKVGEVIKFYRPGKYIVANVGFESADVVNISELMNNDNWTIERWNVHDMGQITHMGRNAEAERKINQYFEENIDEPQGEENKESS